MKCSSFLPFLSLVYHMLYKKYMDYKKNKKSVQNEEIRAVIPGCIAIQGTCFR
ncbi:hypothetical protein HMPREF9406_3561 [Clostridium sp. HGF2]|nr:hypothetical protein HMPREF9406_3561 [Clostridium sp. HGF2]EQJ62598.1 hypothetical protein QSI_0732 [Clostridioides difficile P28]